MRQICTYTKNRTEYASERTIATVVTLMIVRLLKQEVGVHLKGGAFKTRRQDVKSGFDIDNTYSLLFYT